MADKFIVDAVKQHPENYEEGYQAGLHGIIAGALEPTSDQEIAWYLGHSVGYWQWLGTLDAKRLTKPTEH